MMTRSLHAEVDCGKISPVANIHTLGWTHSRFSHERVAAL